jgi:hypothetical protein
MVFGSAVRSKEERGRVWTEKCRSICFEQENKWNYIENKSRIYWFTHEERGGHHTLDSKNTMEESKPHFLATQTAAILKHFQTPTHTARSEFGHKICLRYNKISVPFTIEY